MTSFSGSRSFGSVRAATINSCITVLVGLLVKVAHDRQDIRRDAPRPAGCRRCAWRLIKLTAAHLVGGRRHEVAHRREVPEEGAVGDLRPLGDDLRRGPGVADLDDRGDARVEQASDRVLAALLLGSGHLRRRRIAARAGRP